MEHSIYEIKTKLRATNDLPEQVLDIGFHWID